MRRNKLLIITLSGKRFDRGLKEMVPVEKTIEQEVTGTLLSVRIAESQAVNAFIKEHNLGYCGLKSELKELSKQKTII